MDVYGTYARLPTNKHGTSLPVTIASLKKREKGSPGGVRIIDNCVTIQVSNSSVRILGARGFSHVSGLWLLQFHAGSNSRSPCVLFRADRPGSDKPLYTLWSTIFNMAIQLLKMPTEFPH